MKHQPAVALLIETSNAYARGLLSGVVRFVREQHRPWSIHLAEQGRGGTPPRWLAGWRGDGIIARVENAQIARAVRRKRLPVVDVSAARHLRNVAWVETDDAAIARLAAEHLLERGFRQLAFCGDPAFNWSNWRRDHFVRIVQGHRRACHVFDSRSIGRRGDSQRHRRALADWVRELPKPVGMMACYDIKAREILDLCREFRIAVPEDVAVIGVDNDELLCNLSFPPLSSVIPDAQQTGYEAALLLDRLMRGITVPSSAHLIEPLGVATRQSTDVLAIEDRDVATALRYLREHAYDDIDVADVLKTVTVSRRVLERRFLRIVGRTPHAELARLRIERVKEFLADTDLNLDVISRRAGFRHPEYLSVAFKKSTGRTPSAFRRQHRSAQR
jgi:LacI family transcriptional regulator